jgi:RNA polymerase sigma-70 factor (ECF subfamily)
LISTLPLALSGPRRSAARADREMGLDQTKDESESRLMALAARGDRESFAALVRHHQTTVLAIAFRHIGDRAEAEDVAQEVFLKLWRAAARYRPDAPLTAYLRTLTVNACLDRRRKNRLSLVPDLDQERGAQDPQADAERSERRAALASALALLPAPQRMAVVLFHFEGLTVRETARHLDLSPKAAESLLSRARATLRERLAGALESRVKSQE